VSKDETGVPDLGGTQRRNPPAGTQPAPPSSASAGLRLRGNRARFSWLISQGHNRQWNVDGEAE
jgi:hypothetical protein